jgi:hypothetical protein
MPVSGTQHYALYMLRSEELATVRRVFAKQVLASGSVQDQRLQEAFAGVERERYLGPGRGRYGGLQAMSPRPMPIRFTSIAASWSVSCQSADSIIRCRPHAPLIAGLVLREGEHVAQARLLRRLGSTRRVTAIEFDPALAQRAKQHFSATANVPVLQATVRNCRSIELMQPSMLAQPVLAPDLRRGHLTSAVERSIKSTVPKNMLSNDGLAAFIRVAIDAKAQPGCLAAI